MKTRIYFLDNLRTFMIFLVILLHSSITYTPFLENMWIVNDPQKSSIAGYAVIYIDIFVMFIMFFISGYFIPSSYSKRSFFSFIAAKFRRIMIPWIVAVFTLIPAYKFLFLYSRGLPQQEWYTYFHLFAREGGNMGSFADNPAQSWLWFLPVLFLFQVLYALLARMRVLRLKMKLSLAIGLVFSLSLVYCLVIASLDMNAWFSSPILHFQRDRLLAYFLFFLLGSLCYKLNVFDSQRRSTLLFILSNILAVASLATFTILSNNYFENMFHPGQETYIISEAADGILYYTSVLASVLSIMYVLLRFFERFLNRSGMILSELSRNSYAVYIIHMIVIGVVSMPLLHITMPVILKIMFVVLISFFCSNLLVSGYRKVLGNSLTHPAFRYAAIFSVILLSIMVYSQNSSSKSEQQSLEEEYQLPATSIHMAAIYGDTLSIRQHINAGTDINLIEPSAGSTPLISASLFGKTEAAGMLIRAGADVNYQNNDGSTALHTAAFFCHEDIVSMLLESGAKKDIRNNSGSTALESVLAPWEMVQGIYEYFGNTLGPLGLELDNEYLKQSRPQIAELLQTKH